ncbi:MAG: PASTA domain-containing protein [Chthonomonas sp.]|nr:PASTA domain-containing protein [Chthonomonas sp.]
MIGSLLKIRYELTERLDEGPVFTLYRATDRTQAKEVLIRLIREPFNKEEAFVETLRGTVGHLSTIDNPNVERFFGLDEHEGEPFLLSEARIGQPFDERIRKLAPYSVPVAISMAIQIADAVAAVNEAGFVHGEVTSKSILVSQDGKVTLLQPGVWVSYSKSRLAGSAVLPTIAGYLAPEVSQGTMPSAASDVYAVGVLLYEMLTGRTPFSGDTPIALASKHLTAPVPSLRAINQAVPVPLDEIVKKALSKDPVTRYENSRALLKDLRYLQDAVRFGRTVSWPFEPGAASIEAVASAPVAEAKVESVRTKQYEPPSAANVAAERPKKKVPDELDVADSLPKWLTGIAYTFVCALILMVGSWVFWSLTKPKQIPVPSLEGIPVAEAKQRLEGMGLSLKEGRKEFSERQPEGIILALDPPPKNMVREGSSVSAVISRGSKFVKVPDLKGRTLEEAKSLLLGLDLQIADPIERKRSRELEPGRVLETIPEGRSKVERGTRIRLTVSTDRRDESVAQIADARGSYRLKISMPNGITSVEVRVDITDVSGTRTIHDDRHRPGEVFEIEADGFGDPVYFKIFFNNDLVKSIEKSPGKSAGAVED